ncbi:MAG TPA: hypothetical protein VK507_20160 [Iamia sp.]|nr:hypothetical protein [Iamia sp.]
MATVAAAILVIAAAVVPSGAAPSAPVRTGSAPAPARSDLADLGDLPVQVVTDNGGWCWWQGPRAIVTTDGALLAASTPSTVGAGEREPAADVSTSDLATGRTRTEVLQEGRLTADDHASGAVLELPSGRVVTAWAGHSEEPFVHVAWKDPGAAGWTVPAPVARPETDIALPSRGFGSRANVTYSNLVWAPGPDGGDDVVWDLFRGRGDQPAAMVSADEGETWTYLGLVLSRPGSRPYVRYAASGDRIWFVASLGHPDEVTSDPLLAGFIRDGVVHRTDGAPLGPIGKGVDPERLTEVFRDTRRADVPWAPAGLGGLKDHDAWASDLQVDPSGAPVVTFSVRRPEPSASAPGAFAHDARWARLDPVTGRWTVARLGVVGAAGSDLVEGQPSYTGLAAVDPTRSGVVYLSTDIDPATGEPLVSAATGRVQHEIWEATTPDDGRTWRWAAVTADSRADNLRPVVAVGHGHWALTWLRGRYDGFVDDYAQAVVAIVGPPS